MSDTVDDKKILLSEYNEAGAQMFRIGNIWQNSHNQRKKGDFQSYNWELDGAWIELGADARQIDPDYYIPAWKMINEAIERAPNNRVRYELLKKKEEFLRDLQERAGKGSKKQKQWGRIM